MSDKQKVEQLLEKYRSHPVQRLCRIEGILLSLFGEAKEPSLYCDGWEDELIGPSKLLSPVEEDIRMAKGLVDISEVVKFYVPEHAQKDDVIKVLRAAADILEREWYTFTVEEVRDRVAAVRTAEIRKLLGNPDWLPKDEPTDDDDE